jgi:carboxymethylenebutenolidase
MAREGVTVTHEGVPIFVARPSGAPRAALVLLQEIFGVNAHIRDVARRLAAEGYVVAAPHLFHRLPMQEFDYADSSGAQQAMRELRAPEVLSDVRAALSWLASDAGAPGVPAATVGFCFGGRASFLAATAIDGLFACVAFYGVGIGADAPDAPIQRAGEIACPVLALYGADDPIISADEVRRVDAALEASGVPHEVHAYAGAGHAFFNDARSANHDASAAQDAWARTLRFLAEAAAAAPSRR